MNHATNCVIWEILLAEVTFKTRVFGIYLSKHMFNSDFYTYPPHCQLSLLAMGITFTFEHTGSQVDHTTFLKSLTGLQGAYHSQR